MLSLFIFCVIFVFPDHNNLTSNKLFQLNGVKLLTRKYYNIDIAIANIGFFAKNLFNPPLNLGSLRMELFDISIIVLLAPPLMKATSCHWV